MNRTVKEFMRGVGQSLDLGATMLRRPPLKRLSSTQTIGSYWRTVGHYIHDAGREVEKTSRSRPFEG